MRNGPKAGDAPTPLRIPENPAELKEALRVLFPSISDEDLACAALNISDYLDEVSDFYDALVCDPERYAHFMELTTSETRSTVKDGLVAPTETNTNS
jgi:hypothetical protein